MQPENLSQRVCMFVNMSLFYDLLCQLLKCFFFDFQSMRIGDPSSHDPAPSSTSVLGSKVSSPPRRCSQCAEYSSRILDLETRLTLAKHQAQMCRGSYDTYAMRSTSRR
jgi:hypothetical protein